MKIVIEVSADAIAAAEKCLKDGGQTATADRVRGVLRRWATLGVEVAALARLQASASSVVVSAEDAYAAHWREREAREQALAFDAPDGKRPGDGRG